LRTGSFDPTFQAPAIPKGHNRQASGGWLLRPRHVAAVALVLGLTVAGFIVAHVLAERDAWRESERRVAIAGAQIQSRVEVATSLTESLSQFMSNPKGVTNDQFMRATFRWLSPAGLPAAAWVQEVGEGDRAAYDRRTGWPIVAPDERRRAEASSFSYLPATLISGFAPMNLRGIDLRRELGIAAALDRAIKPGGVGATPIAARRDGTRGLFLVAPAPDLINGVLRAGAVVVFLSEASLRAAARNPAGLRFESADTAPAVRAGGDTVRDAFAVAGQQFALVMPKRAVSGPGAVLPWIILAAGLLLTALVGTLGVIAARRARAQQDFERLADEQSALRRVAELVARQAPREQVFALVTEELRSLLDAKWVRTVRFEPDGSVTVLAALDTAAQPTPRGMNVPVPTGTAVAEVFRTARPARVPYMDDPTPIGGISDARCGVGGPIVVDGRLWGAMLVASQTVEALPSGSEDRVAEFAELVSTSISNIESRAEVERLVAEQSALRRVATLVAREDSPDQVFATVAEELGALLVVDAVAILRYDADQSATAVAVWSDGTITLPVGIRLPLDRNNLAAVSHDGVPEHMQANLDATGPLASTVRELGIHSVVTSPLFVGETVWGAIAALSCEYDLLPADTEQRISEFSRYAALAVANAKSRSDLAQSRARIVRAGDEARRRIERDLHDGAQQRLVSLAMALGAAEQSMPSELGDLRRVLSGVASGLRDALDDLRELSRGLHPVVLSEGGVGPALRSLARRSAVPVDLRLDLGDERFDEPVEAAAYFVASEALANTAKHAHASRAQVSVSQSDRWLELIVTDDGTGGADPANGSGLTGLIDRVEAIGGRIQIDSRAERGTLIHVKLPASSARSPSPLSPS